MTPENFVTLYERALATQRWSEIGPLVHPEVCVTFSNGAVHKGVTAVRSAFEKNFSAIQDEEYRISDVHWIMRSQEFAVYLFEFEWSGLIDGCNAGGAGRGTSVLIRQGDDWKLLAEHLGPNAGGTRS